MEAFATIAFLASPPGVFCVFVVIAFLILIFK